ncbi:MAG: FAD-dependent oxidoreductase [Planctomycetota bacterium]|jgi:hypothetical protein
MAGTYREEAQEIPVRAEVDVLVAGGGPGGLGAAVAAARAGAHPLVIEAQGCLGGQATAALVVTWSDSWRGGLYGEICDRLREKGAITRERSGGTDVETVKRLFDEMIVEAGAHVLFNATAVAPIVEDGAVKGAIIESKSGREAVLAKRVIDATGDADLAARAGCPFEKGRTGDGSLQPCSLMFRMGGVDKGRALEVHSFEDNVALPNGGAQDLAKLYSERGDLPEFVRHTLVYFCPAADQVMINMTNIAGVDATKVADVSRAYLTLRKQIPAIARFLRAEMPGFEKAFVLDSGWLLGVRETRRIVGSYQLTKEDVIEGRRFEDGIGQAFFAVDIHDVKGDRGTTVEKPRRHYEIPYRCLIPTDVENLLVAGRPISATHEAHASLRVIPICIGIGQAAGTAAAVSIEERKTPRKLDGAALKKKLKSLGVEFED